MPARFEDPPCIPRRLRLFHFINLLAYLSSIHASPTPAISPTGILLQPESHDEWPFVPELLPGIGDRQIDYIAYPKPLATSASSSSTDSQTSWALPQNFTLADFDVEAWTWGRDNAAVISARTPVSKKFSAQQKAQAQNGPLVKNQGNVLQVKYPKGSCNPANQDSPQGGAGFYSMPVNTTRATNITFSYSVFFPNDFDFVKGGKLPGLYGGKKGCSGGANSDNCFSTRMMFREHGLGELYLYAPKGKQGPSVCKTPPVSYCSEDYGYSIGRGAWNFTRGAWTEIRQDIWLNHDGKANGGFNIWINGKLIMSANDVYYRNSPTMVAGQSTNKDGGVEEESSESTAATASSIDDDKSDPDMKDNNADGASKNSKILQASGGLLDGILSPLLGPLLSRVRAEMSPVAANQRALESNSSYVTQEDDEKSVMPGQEQETLASQSLMAPEQNKTTIPRSQNLGPFKALGYEHPLATKTTIDAGSATKPTIDAGSPSHDVMPTASTSDPANVISRSPSLPKIPSKTTPIVETDNDVLSQIMGGLLALQKKADSNHTPKAAAQFLGIMSDTFFGGHDKSWATPKDQYTYFRSYKIVINAQ